MPALRLFRRASTGTDRNLLNRAFLYDATFSRILGTPNASEPILSDLLTAWRAALTRRPVDADVVSKVKIVGRTVLGAVLRTKGELMVDLRMRDADENLIVEVQHRAEPLFSHRTLVYASADVVEQHVSSRQDPARGGD